MTSIGVNTPADTPADSRSRSRTTRILWPMMTLFAALIGLVSARYLQANPETYFPEQRQIYEDNTFAILTHIVGSIIALVIGPFQFLPGQRERSIGLHRLMGRVYLGGVMVGGVFGLYMAQLAYGGTVTTVGFSILSVIWLATGVMALQRIRAGDVAAHREWMIRSYALTFAAVTLRLWLPLLSLGFGIEFINSYRATAWLAWIPNLIIAELLIIRPSRRPKVVQSLKF